MAIVLTQPTLDLYEKISKELKGMDGFLKDPTDTSTWSALYEQMLSRPDLRLKSDATAGDMKLHVQNGHLYPATGTILITDWSTSTYETIAYKRVMNDNFTSNAPPTYNGVGNPPGGVLTFDSITGLTGNYLIDSTHIYLVSNQISGVFPVKSGSYLSAQEFAAFLRLIAVELAAPTSLAADADAIDNVTILRSGAFDPDTQIGNKVTITDAGGGPPEDEFSYVVANDANSLTVDPPFSTPVLTGYEFRIDVTFFETYIQEMEKELPIKSLEDGRTEVGPAANLATFGATLYVASLVKIIGQLDGSALPTEEEERKRGQLGMWTPPFTTLRKSAYIGDTKLYVDNASALPYPAFDEDLGAIVPEELTLVYEGGTSIVNCIRNNRRKNGSGEDSVDLEAGLIGDVPSPCYVYWTKAADDFAGKKNQFIVSNPTLSPQAAIPGGLGFFEYLKSMKETVENANVPV